VLVIVDPDCRARCLASSLESFNKLPVKTMLLLLKKLDQKLKIFQLAIMLPMLVHHLDLIHLRETIPQKIW